LLGGLKQFRHLLLRQPNGFLFQANVDFDLTVFGLVNQKLAVVRSSFFSSLNRLFDQLFDTGFGFAPTVSVVMPLMLYTSTARN
jgi:hypothetical protein